MNNRKIQEIIEESFCKIKYLVIGFCEKVLFDISWNLLANVLQVLGQFGILVVLSKLGSPTLVGRYTIGLIVSAPIFMFANLNFRYVLATDANHINTFREYLGGRLVMIFFSLIVIGLVCLFLPYPQETKIVILLISITKAIECVSDLCYGLMMKRNFYNLIALSSAAKSFATLVVVFTVFFLTNRLDYAIIGMAIVWAFNLLFVDLKITVSLLNEKGNQTSLLKKILGLKPCFDPKILKSLISFTFPLGVVALFVALKNSIPRLFVESYMGEYDLGIFAALGYFLTAGKYANNSISASIIPKMSRRFVVGDKKYVLGYFWLLIGFAFVMGLVGVIVSYLWGAQILTIFFTEEYARYNYLLIAIMFVSISAYLSQSLLDSCITLRILKIQVPVIFTDVLLLTLFSVILIPLYGFIGCVLAILIGNLAQIAINSFVIFKALKRINLSR